MLQTEDQRFYRVVVEQLYLRQSYSFALAHRFLFAADLPLLLVETGEPAPPGSFVLPAAGGVSLVDPRLTVRGRLLGPAQGLALGAGVDVWLPLGGGAYVSDGSLRAQPFVALGDNRPSAASCRRTSAFCCARDETLPGVLPTRVGSALTAGVGALGARPRARSGSRAPKLRHALTAWNGAKLSIRGARGSRSCSRRAIACSAARSSFAPRSARAWGSCRVRRTTAALFELGYSPEEPPPPPDGDRRQRARRQRHVPEPGRACRRAIR